jgi:rhodanese-related sulfurtransferase
MPKHRVHPVEEGARMPSPTTISLQKFTRLVGTPKCPAIVDVRTDEDFAADPRVIPGSIRQPFAAAATWAPALGGAPAVVVCQKGQKLSEGVAAWLRHAGGEADVLEGGFLAWAEAGLPLVPTDRLPLRDAEGRTV